LILISIIKQLRNYLVKIHKNLNLKIVYIIYLNFFLIIVKKKKLKFLII
jgi:hypothetical protein